MNSTKFLCTVCRFIAFFLLSSKVNSQPYHNLVFEGAGVRGIAYVGVIKELEDQEIIKNIRCVGGTSAGAIAALTLSLGYSAKEIENIMYNTRLEKFNDRNLFFIEGLSRMNKNYGWYSGRAFLSWTEKIIVNKTGEPDITFQELHNRNFRDLYVTGTSLNNQRLIIFSYKSYPNMKVKDAIRISMSIPLYFEAVCIDSIGHTIDKKKARGKFDIMADGGLTANFPISIFDSAGFDITRQDDLHTIGLRIDSPLQILYDYEHNGLAPMKIMNFRNYVNALYNYTIENLNRNNLTENDWRRTVSISSAEIGPKVKRLSLKEKNILIYNGQVAMRKFLDQALY